MIRSWPMDSEIVWYQDRRVPGYPTSELCNVRRHVTVCGVAWSYCRQCGWVETSQHLIETLTAVLSARLPVRG